MRYGDKEVLCGALLLVLVSAGACMHDRRIRFFLIKEYRWCDDGDYKRVKEGKRGLYIRAMS